jgi:hypothetical protein
MPDSITHVTLTFPIAVVLGAIVSWWFTAYPGVLSMQTKWGLFVVGGLLYWGGKYLLVGSF